MLLTDTVPVRKKEVVLGNKLLPDQSNSINMLS